MKLQASTRLASATKPIAVVAGSDDVFQEIDARCQVSAANLKDFQTAALTRTAQRNVKEFEAHLGQVGKLVAKALKAADQPANTYWYMFADRKLSPAPDAVFRGYMTGKPAYLLVAIDLNGMDKASKMQLRAAFTDALGGRVGRTKDATGIIVQVMPG